MSLVGSTPFFRSNELYLLEDDDDNPALSGSVFYTNGSYAVTTSYDPKYYSLNHDSELDSSDDVDCNEDRMRSKLQELEKALFDDDDDENHSQCMEIDPDWLESSSSNSNLSRPVFSPKHLLFECAAAIHDAKFTEASRMINVLRQRVSIQGAPSDRIAAYMVEALAARMAKSGRGLYKALKCKEAPSSDRLSAMQVLFEVCPCFRFGCVAANGAILEAFKDEKRVHIIDFGVNQGSQYYTLLQTLAKTPGERPYVRLTGVDDPESVHNPIGGLRIVGRRLELLAEDLELPFEFQAVATNAPLVSPSALDCQPGEALIVNFAFQLHHLPDESVSTLNLRDRLLQMIKGLKPKLVVVVEQEVNTNTSPFLQRFGETYEYYAAVFDSLDATLARDSQDRMNVEKQCLARDIINAVACEGEERVERYEVAGKWRSRMSMAGFTASPVSRNVQSEMKKMVKKYSERYGVREEKGGLNFGWEDRTLVVTSVWR